MDPADITGWLPGGSGHVLITSRERNWTDLAVPVDIDVLDRPEAIAILQTRVSGLSEADADRLADQLGDLPLVVAQAAGFMAETGMAAAQYLGLLQTKAGQLLDQAASGSSYPRSLAAATQLIADRLDREDAAAAQLASLCAFLAPEPIAEDLFTSALADSTSPWCGTPVGRSRIRLWPRAGPRCSGRIQRRSTSRGTRRGAPGRILLRYLHRQVADKEGGYQLWTAEHALTEGVRPVIPE